MPVLRKKLDVAEKVAKRWVRAIELMERYKDKLHIIRYEDLVRNKKQELKALCQWLGVDCTGFTANIIENNRIGTYKENFQMKSWQQDSDLCLYKLMPFYRASTIKADFYLLHPVSQSQL